MVPGARAEGHGGGKEAFEGFSGVLGRQAGRWGRWVGVLVKWPRRSGFRRSGPFAFGSKPVARPRLAGAGADLGRIKLLRAESGARHLGAVMSLGERWKFARACRCDNDLGISHGRARGTAATETLEQDADLN